MSIFKRFQKPVPAEDDAQASPRNVCRCFRCGGYEECEDDPQDRFSRMSAEQTMPQASYPVLPCPCCQEVR